MISQERLRRAIDEQAFLLHYLPMVELETSRTVAVEALLRMADPPHGVLAPADFLPLAEESGLIVEIGYWVLREACCQVRDWESKGLPTLGLGINLSSGQCLEPEFAKNYLAVVREAGIDPARLSLEVAPELLAGHMAGASPLTELQAAGMRVALDNFGVGYVNMQDFAAMGIDTVKIDRSLIRDLEESTELQSLVFDLFEQSRDQGFQVVAEGVETEQQLERLEGYGCRYMQGFLFDGPQPPTQIEALFRG